MESSKSTLVAFPDSNITDLDAFLRTLTPSTRVEYARAIRNYETFYWQSILLTSPRDIEAYLSHLVEAKYAPATIGKILSALSRYFRLLVRDGVVAKNPVDGVTRPKISDESPRVGVEPTEVQAILSHCASDTLLGLRDRAMITTLATQGWRLFETLGLTVEDLGEEQGHRVAVVHGKGGKTRRVPLAAPTFAALDIWIRRAGLTSGPIFLQIRQDGSLVPQVAISSQAAEKRVEVLAEKAGLRHIHPHLFRHGAITVALESVPLHQVQDFARHADPRTTRRYDSNRHSLNNPAPHVLAAKMLGKGEAK